MTWVTIPAGRVYGDRLGTREIKGRAEVIEPANEHGMVRVRHLSSHAEFHITASNAEEWSDE